MLPDAYERVLEIWSQKTPIAAARAKAALSVLLKDLLEADDADAFTRSALTHTGSPFEPAFSFSAPGLRYTVAPAPAEMPQQHRLQQALALLLALKAPFPDPALIAKLVQLQEKGRLAYGAQIGARHNDSSDTFKLYVEVPPESAVEADLLATELLGSRPVLNVPGRDAHPTIFGINLHSGLPEIYYRIENLHPLEIATLLSRANAADRAPEILEILSKTQKLPIRHELPGKTWGFSYSKESNGDIAFSIYTFARTLFGPDGWVRAGVLSLAEDLGWDAAVYAQMSEPLVNSRSFISRHGLFGLVMPPGMPPAAWVGLAP